METFSTAIQNRLVILDNAADVVRFNYYSSESSIAYLNLILCEFSTAENNSRPFFVSSEEKCRKIFAQSRSLLYNLNLDLAKGRECDLNESGNSISFTFDENVPHIGRIVTSWGFYSSIMSGLVEEALEVTDRKSKILGLLLQKRFLEDEILYDLETHVVNQFIDIFKTEGTHSGLCQSFMMNFNLLAWVSGLEQPELLESLLRNACNHTRDFAYPYQDLIDTCFLNGCLVNIGPILKIKDAPEFSEDLHNWFMAEISELRPNLTEEVFEAATIFVTEERLFLMLQILWMFLISARRLSTETTSATLRLIWSSIPDPCITLAEFENVFNDGRLNNELGIMYDFYCSSIDEIHLNIEPRSLKHLCRAALREILWENEVWIPDGVSQMGLPKELVEYLNLERRNKTT